MWIFLLFHEFHQNEEDMCQMDLQLGNKIEKENRECPYWAKGCEIPFACLILKNWIVKLNQKFF